ncbi:uncharacterized protein LOC143566033 [Bidens hawaiensis]|uniref:uncharacterized protein LOC143566033 n=1 Tax=Bidens hawaiensis TaxID=980011 RepID=UPI00404BA296
MEEELLEDFVGYSSVQSIWKQLDSRFNRPISYKEQGVSADVPALREDLKYIQVSAVNVTSFVSVKLSVHSNYNIWKAQMTFLLNSQALLHIIVVKNVYTWEGVPVTKKYDNLVKGWIFGTINDQLLKDFARNDSVRELWQELKLNFDSPEDTNEQEEKDSPRFKFRTEPAINVPEMETTDNNRLKKGLYEAAVVGCWWKAKSIVKVHENAATEAITENGNTILHLAVELGHNYFVEKLLEFLKDDKDIETQNDKGRTALHIAAMVGNAQAAQFLVKKRKALLEIKDHDRWSPLDSALSHMKVNMFAYLYKLALSSDLSDYGTNNSEMAIQAAIYTKQYG